MNSTIEAVRRVALSRGAQLWAHAGLADLFYVRPTLATNKSAVIASNHTSVMDSVVAINIMASFDRPWHVQADDQMISRFHLLYDGVYLPVGSDKVETARALTQVRRLLIADSDRIVWTYPQGDHFRASSKLMTHRGPTRLTSGSTDFWAAWISYEVFRSTRPTAAVGFHYVGTGKVNQAAMDDGLLQARYAAEDLMRRRITTVRKTFGD